MCPPAEKVGSPISPTHTHTHTHTLNVRVRRAHCRRPSHRSNRVSADECSAHMALCVGSSFIDITLQRAGHAQGLCQTNIVEAKPHFCITRRMAGADSPAPDGPTCMQSVRQRMAEECARQLRKSAPPSPPRLTSTQVRK